MSRQQWTSRQQWVSPVAVSASLLDVMLPSRGSSPRKFCIDRPNYSARNSHHEGTRRHLHSLSYYCTSSHDAPGTDPNPIQQHAAHSDKAIISNGTTMENYSMPDSDTLANSARHARVYMNDAAVLDVGLGTDDDCRHISPQYGTVPDAAFFAQSHVAHNGGGRGDECARVNRRGAQPGDLAIPAPAGTTSASTPRRVRHPLTRDAR
jgi:hypothetical protein